MHGLRDAGDREKAQVEDEETVGESHKDYKSTSGTEHGVVAAASGALRAAGETETGTCLEQPICLMLF